MESESLDNNSKDVKAISKREIDSQRLMYS